VVLLLGAISITNVKSQDHAAHMVAHHCTTEERMLDGNHTLAIEVVNQGDALSFNVSELNAPKDTCVMIMLVSRDTTVEHDFTIDMVNDTDGNMMMNKVHVAVMEANDTVPMQMGHFLMQTPNTDITVNYYCGEAGHRQAGMEGKLIIGDGSPVTSPGFDFSIVIISFILIIGVIFIRKKRLK